VAYYCQFGHTHVCKEIGRGVRKLTGENLKLVLDEFSTLS
jgi:hypothetical protein